MTTVVHKENIIQCSSKVLFSSDKRCFAMKAIDNMMNSYTSHQQTRLVITVVEIGQVMYEYYWPINTVSSGVDN